MSVRYEYVGAFGGRQRVGISCDVCHKPAEYSVATIEAKVGRVDLCQMCFDRLKPSTARLPPLDPPLPKECTDKEYRQPSGKKLKAWG